MHLKLLRLKFESSCVNNFVQDYKMNKVSFLLLIIFFTAPFAFSQDYYATTIYPFKLILEEILGESGTVYTILPPGASPHTYQLKPSDLRHVTNARALIIGGHGLDDWAFDLQHKHLISLLDVISHSELLYQGEDKGNEIEYKEEKYHNHHHHKTDFNPHFWTNPLTVKVLLDSLVNEMMIDYPESRKLYEENKKTFASALDSLHEQIDKMLVGVKGSKVMLSHPFYDYFFNQ